VFLRNVCCLSPDNTALYHRRYNSPCLRPLRKYLSYTDKMLLLWGENKTFETKCSCKPNAISTSHDAQVQGYHFP
jgi:hypothetical protein